MPTLFTITYFMFLLFARPIAFLSTLLGAEDRAVRMAAGEALALCFELNLLDGDTGVAGSSKSKLFLDMQALKAKISGLASNLSAEAGGKGADKKNLADQRDLFQRILDFVKVWSIFIVV